MWKEFIRIKLYYSRLSPYYIYIKKSAKHEVANHGIKWFNMFFADYFKNL